MPRKDTEGNGVEKWLTGLRATRNHQGQVIDHCKRQWISRARSSWRSPEMKKSQMHMRFDFDRTSRLQDMLNV